MPAPLMTSCNRVPFRAWAETAAVQPLLSVAWRGIVTVMSEVTRVLSAIEEGDPHAAERLLPLVYDELRKLAAQKLAHEKPGQTLQATALVHEAYLRLVTPSRSPPSQGGEKEVEQRWHGRGHFFAAAAEAMRRILVEQARHKQSQRRGGGRGRCEIHDADRVGIPVDDELIDLDEALAKLAAADPQAAEIVKLRVFAGMTVEEVAQVQGVSARTVKRHWVYARAWLGRQLAPYDQERPGPEIE
jgi:RNA polymerase sigma factor (TIGR02999 family)